MTRRYLALMIIGRLRDTLTEVVAGPLERLIRWAPSLLDGVATKPFSIGEPDHDPGDEDERSP